VKNSVAGNRRRGQRLLSRKQTVINAFKGLHGCATCGEKDPVVLDLDHLDPATKSPKLRQSRWAHLNWIDFYEELTKVQVLCANCHRRKTSVNQDRLTRKK
jgi:5-methylcytosine-specific restriction endonuclease McrA